MTELKTIRSELRASLSGHTAELLRLQESLDAQSATVGELSMQLRHAQESLVQETHWRTQLEKRARSDSHAFAAMKLALIHHRDLTNSSVLEAQVWRFMCVYVCLYVCMYVYRHLCNLIPFVVLTISMTQRSCSSGEICPGIAVFEYIDRTRHIGHCTGTIRNRFGCSERSPSA